MADDKTDAQAGQGAETGADTDTSTKTAASTDRKADKRAEKKAARADKRAEKKAAKAEQAPKDSKGSGSSRAKSGAAVVAAGTALIRTRVAQVIWLLCVVAALLLALAALTIALDFNQANPAVEFVLNGAESVDLGIFTVTGGIKEFGGSNADTKNALVNYGLGAVVWLVAGRVLSGVVRP